MRIRVRQNFRSLSKDGLEHSGLSELADFYVIGVTAQHYRVVNSRGEPILYPKALFEVLDVVVPFGWQFREYEDGEYFLEPTRVGRPGFYEDWHGSDGDHVAQADARQLLRDELQQVSTKASEPDKAVILDALLRLI